MKKNVIKAWAVVRNGNIVQYQNYDCVPNDILFRICRTRKQAFHLELGCTKVVQVEIKVCK